MLFLLLPICALVAQEKDWYKHAVFYEIYPRSFADSNNDGIGDLNGITAHLDYLKRLGVDAIWITPCFPSPQVDFGYDVSDYESIDPAYGTLADFDRLVAEARKRNIRIVLDFVLNHTSDKHPWFQESRSSLTSPRRNWFVWRDGVDGKPPNNWGSVFGGPAWQLDSTTNQYYLHQFYPEQPDLNWRDPAVEDAMMEVARFWFKRGVAGFRLDAVDRIYEDPDFRDNPISGDTLVETYTRDLPELHNVLRHLRQVANEYNAVLIGETWTSSVEDLQRYYNSLQLPMNFVFTMVNKPSAVEFRKQIADAERGLGWPVYLFSNHDITRHYDRYGNGTHNDQITKALAAMYLTLRGTPILYYGEEIGMQNNDPVRVEDVKDPIGRRFWPKNKGRDGERTPMQWSAGLNGGFSETSSPWLPVPDSARTHNVATEEKDPNSILSFYRRLLGLRRKNQQLREGEYVALNESDPNVLSYLRVTEGNAVLVAINLSPAPQKVAIDLTAKGYSKAKTLLATESRSGSVKLSEIPLAPFGVYIGQLK